MNKYGSSNVSARLAMSNIRKKKKNMLTLAILIMVVAATLGVALTLFLQKDKFFDDIRKAENLADFSVIIQRSNYRDEFEEFILNDSRVLKYEKENGLYMANCENTSVNMQLEVLLLDLDTEREINTFNLFDGYAPDECEAHGISRDEAIYLPIYFRGLGCDIGDDYFISYKGNKLQFRLAGFFETGIYSAPNSGAVQFFLFSEGMETAKGKMDECLLLQATLRDGIDGSDKFAADFKNNTSFALAQSGFTSFVWSSFDVKLNLDSNLYIGAGIFIVMSLLSLIVVFTVMCFEISENIHDSTQDIGILEAIGYKSGQIAASYILQYGSAALLGSFLGSLFSIAICKLLTPMVYTKLCGLACDTRVDPMVIAVCIAFITAACLICVLFPIRRLKKCTILTALRGGGEDHSFRTNFFPLHKGNGDVNVRMSLKNLFTEKKQNLIICSVVFLCMLLMGIMICMRDTFKDGKSILNHAGCEMSDIQAIVSNGADIAEIKENIIALPEFRKALCSEQRRMNVEDREVTFFITDDYSLLESVEIPNGDPPMLENEIVLSDKLCQILGKDIGDKVEVSVSGVKTECFITGKTPVTTNQGIAAFVNTSLMKLLISDYSPTSIDLYFSEGVTKEQAVAALSRKYKVADKEKLSQLTDGVSADGSSADGKYAEAAKIAEEKIALMLSDYGFTDVSYSVALGGEIILSGNSDAYKIKSLEDNTKRYEDMLVQFMTIYNLITIIILIISCIMTAAILSMMVRNKINKKRFDYGVLKSMGYSSADLIKQDSVSYMMSGLVGAAVGIVTVIVSAQSVVGSLFEMMMGASINIYVNAPLIASTGAAMVVFIFVFSLICLQKIKKISVYSLMTE